jgi:hypothetical protein
VCLPISIDLCFLEEQLSKYHAKSFNEENVRVKKWKRIIYIYIK